MRNTIKSILLLLPFTIAACQEEMERYTLERPQDTMGLQASAGEVVLTQDQSDEKAITFTWNDAADRGEGTTLTYYFKMDIADNNFATSIPKVKIAEGTRSISYTHKEINNLLNSWKVPTGEQALVEAEVIAEVSGGSVYMKPEISKAQFLATGYYVMPVDLFIMGTALDITDPADALKIIETAAGEKYEWSSHLKPGTFKFIKERSDLSPSYTQGANAGELVYNETESGNQTPFSITTEGYYLITLDMNAMSISCTSLTSNEDYDNVWALGSATPIGWDTGNAIQLEKLDPFTFVYTGPLYAGELKFMLQNDRGYDCDYLMATTAGASVNATSMVRKNYPNTNDANDTKWVLGSQDAGNYVVTLDTYRMSIQFKKK